MTVVGVIRRDADAAFVRDEVLPVLGPLGVDKVAENVRPSLLDGCAALLVVVTADLAGDSAEAVLVRTAAEAALRSTTPVIVVQRSRRDALQGVLRELAGAPTVDPDIAADRRRLWCRLALLIPRRGHSAPVAVPIGEPVAWSPEAFSVLLADSVRRGDFTAGAALVSRFAAHVRGRGGEPYPAGNLRDDLRVLRERRQFLLMRRYTTAAVEAGVADLHVRRQLGQALIELKESDAAIAVLDELVTTSPRDDEENIEGRGLLGRANKQRYVDAGADARPESLTTAIGWYWSVFVQGRTHVWHGVNAASCALRALRDRVPLPPMDPPEAVAQEVLDILETRGPLDIWGSATRVEAYLDIGEYGQAMGALHRYLAHPGLTAFEVYSTFRQFDEVLQLREIEAGSPIVEALAECAVRMSGAAAAATDVTPKPYLVQVSDPGWTGERIPGLVVDERLGTVVAVTGTRSTLEALVKDSEVIAVEESRPAPPPDCARTLPFIGARAEYQPTDGPPFAERGTGALVAIIDDSIDVLHQAFLDEHGESRIVGVWDQTDPAADPAVPYGRLHTAADIAAYVAAGSAPQRLTGNRQHGTHVASIAMGRTCGPFTGGVAPDARLLVVMSAADDGTKGYQTTYMTALDFIDRTAEQLGLPVVVNVSQGLNAGAHDGSSLVENAFNNFSFGGSKPGRVVVKSAGNERDKRGHARLTVPPGGVDELVWQCPAGYPRTAHVELWWDRFNSYRFRLRSPRGEESKWVGQGAQTATGYFTGQGEYSVTLAAATAVNGDRKLAVDLALGYSSRTEPDVWTLTVEADDVRRAGAIEAWIERDDGPPTEFTIHATEEMTLSVPGTAASVITVGAVDVARPIRVAPFSAYGPTRDGRESPTVCAPGVGVVAALSGSTNGVVALDGTSMAAPHVSGAVALMFSRMAASPGATQLTAAQVASLLQQNTLCRNEFWDRGQGHGVIDLAALMEVALPAMK